MKYAFAFFLLIHGLIHLMGFVKAYNFAEISQLTREISKPSGFLWLIAFILFITSGILLVSKKESWPILAISAVFISQVLIFMVWKDARFGTIANFFILLIAVLSWGLQHFEAQLKTDVKTNLERTNHISSSVLTESDIQHLPDPVQKYLRYAGVLNKPKVKNIKVVFDGEMREKGKDWFKFRSVQYNFFDDPTRLFFMKAKMFGITVPGYHRYQAETASMDIRLFGLLSIVKVKGNELNKAETVTLFNDMCILAPATLIDKRIQWEEIDSLSAKAKFSNGSNVISAILYFNELGQLVNFISDDRYAVSDMKSYPFSTPMKDYKLYSGIQVPSFGEAVWHYPEGEFAYGKFTLSSIEYNLSEFK